MKLLKLFVCKVHAYQYRINLHVQMRQTEMLQFVAPVQ